MPTSTVNYFTLLNARIYSEDILPLLHNMNVLIIKETDLKQQ
jgi:hypothetical protein